MRKLLQQALHGLKDAREVLRHEFNDRDAYQDEIEALEAELAKPEQGLKHGDKVSLTVDDVGQIHVSPEQELSWGAVYFIRRIAELELEIKQLKMNIRDQTALHLLYKGDYEVLLAKSEQECNRCAAREYARKRLLDAGFLKSPLRQELAKTEQDHGFDRTASRMAGEYVDTKQVNTSAERVHKSGESIHEMQRLGQELEQEPVAYLDVMDCNVAYVSPHRKIWLTEREDKEWRQFHYLHKYDTALYAASPHKEWVGLTDDEIINTANSAPFEEMVKADDYIYVLARAIEAKLKEKNYDNT